MTSLPSTNASPSSLQSTLSMMTRAERAAMRQELSQRNTDEQGRRLFYAMYPDQDTVWELNGNKHFAKGTLIYRRELPSGVLEDWHQPNSFPMSLLLGRQGAPSGCSMKPNSSLHTGQVRAPRRRVWQLQCVQIARRSSLSWLSGGMSRRLRRIGLSKAIGAARPPSCYVPRKRAAMGRSESHTCVIWISSSS